MRRQPATGWACGCPGRAEPAASPPAVLPVAGAPALLVPVVGVLFLLTKEALRGGCSSPSGIAAARIQPRGLPQPRALAGQGTAP